MNVCMNNFCQILSNELLLLVICFDYHFQSVHNIYAYCVISSQATYTACQCKYSIKVNYKAEKVTVNSNNTVESENRQIKSRNTLHYSISHG